MKQKILLEQKIKLLRLCSDMDKDSSGSVSLDELNVAYDESAEFRSVMLSLEVQREELKQMFTLLDADGGGEVDYKEFVDQLYTLSTCDMRMMLAMNRMDTSSMKTTVEGELTEQLQKISESLEVQQKILKDHACLLDEVTTNMRLLACKDKHEDDDVMSNATAMTAGKSVRKPTKVEQRSDTLTEISDLRQYLLEMAGTKADILRKAEDQECMLLGQAEILCSVQSALSNPSGFNDDLTAVGKQVRRLRRSMHERLTPVLQELERRVEEELSTLTSSARVLDCLTTELKIPPPAPQPTKGRGSHHRLKVSPLAVTSSGPEAPQPPESNRPEPFPASIITSVVADVNPSKARVSIKEADICSFTSTEGDAAAGGISGRNKSSTKRLEGAAADKAEI